MYCSLQKLLPLFLTSHGLCWPFQHVLPDWCTSDIYEITGKVRIVDDATRYGYEGPGIYNILSYADGFRASLGASGTGDGAAPVTW